MLFRIFEFSRLFTQGPIQRPSQVARKRASLAPVCLLLFSLLSPPLLATAVLAGPEDAHQEPFLFGPEEPHYQRAAHLLREDDVPAALAEIEEARELAPDSPRVLRVYAKALILSGRGIEARQVLARLDVLQPPDPAFDYEIALLSFRMADWELARDRLSGMAGKASEPGHAYIYLGAAYQQLGDYESAEASFAQALWVDSELAGAVAYRRGLLALQLRDFPRARSQFESVLELLPGTPMANSAAGFIQQLKGLEPKSWEVFVRAGMGYDSNINLATDEDFLQATGEDGWRALTAAGGSYEFGNEELGLQVGQTLYGHFYTSDGEFDQQTSLTWAWAHYQINEDFEADLRYGFEFAWADWKQYRSSQNVEPGLTWDINEDWALRASYRIEDRTYYFTPPTPEFNRNGTVEYVGGDLFYVLPRSGAGTASWLRYFLPSSDAGASSWLRVGYRYRDEETTGDQFDATGHQPAATLALGGLPWQLQAMVDARVEWRDYAVASFYGPTEGPRRDRIATLRAGLERPLGRNASVEVAYRFTDRDSNVDFFTYQRHEISFMGTYRY